MMGNKVFFKLQLPLFFEGLRSGLQWMRLAQIRSASAGIQEVPGPYGYL